MKKLLTAVLLSMSFSAIADNASSYLSAHNKWRVALNAGEIEGQPRPNPPIKLMEWDNALEQQAQDYADSCPDDHASYEDRFGAGENLAWGFYPSSAVDVFAKEYKQYTYPGGFSYGTGHYTQVVWNDSTKVGCAFGCGRTTVCRYLSHGNFNNNAPYKVHENRLSEIYTNDFTINARYNYGTYKIRMIDLELVTADKVTYNSEVPQNYLYYEDDTIMLYIPTVIVDGIDYYVILEYNNAAFEVHNYGKNNVK